MPAGSDAIATRRDVLVAVLATVTWGACSIAADGFVALLADRGVPPVAGAPPVLVAVASAASAAALCCRLLAGVRTGGRAAALLALDALVLVFAADALVGAVGWMLVTGSVGEGLYWLLRAAADPLTLLLGLLAAACAALFALVAGRSWSDGTEPPAE